MKKFLDLLSNEVGSAFEKAGYEKELGRVTISNRPDLCEYQCNGAMAGAKKYKKAPVMIANEVAEFLKNSEVFEKAEVVHKMAEKAINNQIEQRGISIDVRF